MSRWWNAYNGNLIGSIAGAAIGVIGGCLGAAAGYFAPRGKAKTLIFGVWATMIAAAFCGMMLVSPCIWLTTEAGSAIRP